MANKKSFLETDNPTLAFISASSVAALESQKENTPSPKAETQNDTVSGHKVNPLYVETKTIRIQLILQPSLYKKIKAASKKEGLSLNAYAHKLFAEATKDI